MSILPTIAGGTGRAGLGGVSLDPSDYPRIRPERVRAIERRANAGALTTADRLTAPRRSTRSVTTSATVFRDGATFTWEGYIGRGIRDDGSIGTIELFEPSQAAGRDQVGRWADNRVDNTDIGNRVRGWTLENNGRIGDYARAVNDALEQIAANARAAADLDASITTPEERRAAFERQQAMKRQAARRAEQIFDRIARGTTREARALGARLARIQSSAGLVGAYAAALDSGADPAVAAAELVPDVVQTAEELSALDRLYPLQSDDYYLETFDALPTGWPEFYVHFVDAGAPALQPDEYYLQTFDALPDGWKNLYFQALAEL